MYRAIVRLFPPVFCAALLLWGVYATLAFLGVDGHIVVLMENDTWQQIAQETQELPFMWKVFVRGWRGLVPFVLLLFERLDPFRWFAIISALAYGAYVGWTILSKGVLYIDAHVRPWHVLGLFVVSTWLIFTTLFYANLPGLQPRLLIEPTPEALDEKVSPQGIAILQENFKQLKSSGCLKEDPERRTTQSGSAVYWYRGWCMQKAFITRVLSQMGALTVLVLDFLILGRMILRRLKFSPAQRTLKTLMSLGVGAAAMTMILWLCAAAHVLNSTTAWLTLFLIPVIGYRELKFWLHALWNTHWRVRSSFYDVRIVIFWVLIAYIAFNFITVVRPFPIGWDDLGRYINGPRQIGTFGHIIPGMLSVQWEYLTALGFLLFGYFSTFGATLAQQINWLSGLLAVCAVYGCTRLLLGSRSGLFAALFYYTLPMVGHFSFADMKTENALLFYGVLGLVAVLAYLKEGARNMRWLVLAGILFAAGIATKPTIVLLALAAGVVLTFHLLGKMSGVGSMLLALLVFAKAGALNLEKVAERLGVVEVSSFATMGQILLFVLGTGFLFLPLAVDRHRSAAVRAQRKYWRGVAMLAAGFLLFSAPWMARNVVANGGRITFSTMLGAPNSITPKIAYSKELLPLDAPSGSRVLPDELALDRNHPACIGTAEQEELDRYWGYRTGITHFLGVPWRVVMNLDSQGYYLTTSPLILLIPLLLLVPFFWKRRLLVHLFFGIAFSVIAWILAASGIPWYGIGMFVGVAVFVEALVMHVPLVFARVTGGVLSVLAIGMCLSLRMWQFGMQQNLYEYAWGKASAEVLEEMTIPDYDDISEAIIELSRDKEHPYLYRMGTFISYFVPRNREIIAVNDNQLVIFNCLNQEEDHVLTLKRLRALGFHSIVFDTNTATIEKDPNGTLHQKVNKFVEFANSPESNVVSVVNNPGGGIAYMILQDPPEEEEKKEQ